MNIAQASIPAPATFGEPAQPDTGSTGGAFAALIALLFGPPTEADAPEQKPTETATTPLPIPLPLIRQPVATEPAPVTAPAQPSATAASTPVLPETITGITVPESTPDVALDLPQPKPVAAPAPQPTATVQTPSPTLPQAPAEVTAVRPERLASDVGIEIVRQIGSGRSEFSIRLDPPDFGRVDVRLEFNRGEVRAVVTSDNPATHDLLRRDAESLARMFADSGFRADSGAFRFDLRQETGQNQQAGTAEVQAVETAPQPEAELARAHRGLLDLVA